MIVIKNTCPKAVLKLREITPGSPSASASSFTSRGKCSPSHRQTGTQIRRCERSQRHRLGLEGTTHSTQNVISMQMKGAGIRNGKVETVTGARLLPWGPRSHIIRVKWGMKAMCREPRGRGDKGGRRDAALLEEMMFRSFEPFQQKAAKP